jgi:hypothetical protein
VKIEDEIIPINPSVMGLLEIPCQSDKIISRIEHGRTI